MNPKPRRHLRPIRPFDHGEPMRRIELGPLAGVLLVAVAFAIGAFPIRTHTLLLDFPTFSPAADSCLLDWQNPCPNHIVSIAEDGAMLWDGKPITQAELRSALQEAMRKPIRPTLSFLPAPNASYGATLVALDLIGEEVGSDGFLCIGVPVKHKWKCRVGGKQCRDRRE